MNSISPYKYHSAKHILTWFIPLLAIATVSASPSVILNQHPRLFFTADDIPALRERVQKEAFATRWSQFMARADQLIQESPAGNSRHNLGNMGTLAFAYIITENPAYAKRAIAEALAGIERGVWISPNHIRFNEGADLVGAELTLGLALVYDWCHHAMSETERGIIRTAILEKGLGRYKISVTDPKEWWFEHPINNWRGVCHGGMAVAALALYHESDLAKELADIARVQIPRVFEDTVLIDGGGHEGVGYYNYGITYAITGLMAQKQFYQGEDQQQVLESLKEKLAGYWSAYMHGPDQRYANIGRMVGTWGQGLWSMTRTNGGPASDTAALYESLVAGGDEMLLWTADNGSDRFYWPGASPFWFLWRREDAPSLDGAPKPNQQAAVLFRGAGHAIFQSDDLWLAFSGGRIHNRKDLGAFVLVYGKERLVHLPNSNEDTATGDQSTVLVNGVGQIKDYETDGYKAFGSGENFHYLAVDFSNAYETDILERFVRHLLMVNGKYIVILDDLAASEPSEFEARIQTEIEKVSSRPEAALIQGSTATLHVIAKSEAELDVQRGDSVIRYLSIKPKERTKATTLVSVLYPDMIASRAPIVHWSEDGVLRVNDDIIQFHRDTVGYWHLHSVNGEGTDGITDGRERSLIPLRHPFQ